MESDENYKDFKSSASFRQITRPMPCTHLVMSCCKTGSHVTTRWRPVAGGWLVRIGAALATCIPKQ